MNFQQAKAEAIELLKPEHITTRVDRGAPEPNQRAQLPKGHPSRLRYRYNIGVKVDSPIGTYTRVEGWGDTWDEAIAMIRRKKKA